MKQRATKKSNLTVIAIGAALAAFVAIAPLAQAAPQPVNGKTVVIKPLGGSVEVKEPAASKFREISKAKAIPTRSLIRGSSTDKVKVISSNPGAKGRQVATLTGGTFKVSQQPRKREVWFHVTTPKFHGGCGDSPFPKRPNELWVAGKGKFGTTTVGARSRSNRARWFTSVGCSGSYFKVKRGRVEAGRFGRPPTVFLKKGQSHLFEHPIATGGPRG